MGTTGGNHLNPDWDPTSLFDKAPQVMINKNTVEFTAKAQWGVPAELRTKGNHFKCTYLISQAQPLFTGIAAFNQFASSPVFDLEADLTGCITQDE